MKPTRKIEVNSEEARSRLAQIREKNPEAAKEIERVQKELVDALLRAAIKDGDLRVDGKSKSDASRAVVRFLEKCLRSSEFHLTIDYKRTLLEEAQGAAQRDEPQVAIILLGTHFEHYLNELILAGCRRKKINEGIAVRLIRTTPFFEKLSPLPQELGIPTMPPHACGAIREVGKLRNELVHYRWEGKPQKEREEYSNRVRLALKRGFAAAKQIVAYDEATFYSEWNRVSAVPPSPRA